MTQYKGLGFTLVELLITLCIVSVIFFLCQTPLSLFFTSVSHETDAHRFFQTLAFARQVAIKGNRLIFVCPTKNQKECESDWSQGYMVFYYPSPSQRIIELLRVEKNSPQAFIQSNTALIQFSGDGRSLNRATFKIMAAKPFKIVVFDSGRIRLAATQ